MSRLNWKLGVMTLAVCIGGLLIAPALSQDAKEPPKKGDGKGDGKGGDRRRGGPSGGFNMDEMQARFLGFMKDRLKADDDEWKVIEPRLKKVMTMGMQARGGGLSMMGRGPGGPPGGGDGGGGSSRPTDESEVGKASRALRDLIEKDDAKPDQINAALETLRSARKKAQNELDAARKELRELLTLKQEATLVAMGMLE